ncbi:hypothetical protein GF1_16940 [Desulfolithobacter dissulfuricans]|uniref:Uncharacterized protein n=1 Tax=Desulfolithobacter dissulfuricans TaxID=2795293 RepID=A0A915U0N9_9BACT|nr:recombinase [Desulfolithobacter dissulfuricans]BCO09318.1 hypothetical protein GF1_16940 [Desulfolithobacter dissulfuricans]
MENTKNSESTNERKVDWNEIVERKIFMAKERGSRVIRINSPFGFIMFNIMRQFDQAYANFKGKLGEPGGITHEEGAKLMEEAQEIALAFSRFTARLSRKVGFKYRVPRDLKEFKALREAAAADSKKTEPVEN